MFFFSSRLYAYVLVHFNNKHTPKVTFWQVLLQTLPIGLVFLSFTTFENGLTDNSVLYCVSAHARFNIRACTSAFYLYSTLHCIVTTDVHLCVGWRIVYYIVTDSFEYKTYFTIADSLTASFAHFRYLGVLGTSGSLSRESRQITDPTEKCNNSPYLEPRQRELCAQEKRLIDVIGAGASMGIDECKHQFKARRWNCTTFNSTDVFGNVIKISKCSSGLNNTHIWTRTLTFK